MRRHYGAAALTVIALAATAACGGGGGGGVKAASGSGGGDDGAASPAQVIQAAAKQSGELTSLSYVMKGSAAGGQAFEAKAEMSMDPVAMRMTMGAPAGGAGAGTGGGAGAAGMEFRLIGQQFFMKTPAPAKNGKSWLKVDTGKMPGVADGVQQNPVSTLAGLADAKDLKEAGTEKVDGVDTTHYTGTVTLEQLRAALKENGNRGAGLKAQQNAIDQYAKTGVESVDMEVWIDAKDRLKQLRTRAEGSTGPTDMKITVTGYDKPVRVEAPPASEVGDLAEAFRR
ncbi:hypothetical protein ABT160_36305 [Streptomyces sp. NPDC001941]|uniref:hypothetical protein n=1 Tax=Streptomyces sp. NPDC001941 TaxID=3154659 RepID=UPI0033246B5A